MSFTKNMVRNLDKNTSKKLSSKYSQKLLDHPKQSTTDALKTNSKTAILKTAEATCDLIGTKISVKRRIQKQIKKKKYLEKDIFLQNKD